MRNKNPTIERLYKYLSEKAREAYQDPLLIANIVLSKQLTSGRVLENYIENKTPPRITSIFVLKMIFLYTVKNLTKFILCLIASFMHKLSGQKFHAKEEGELIILDTFFLVEEILKNRKFEDSFFPGLSRHLKKIEKKHTYTPRLFGTNNPFKLFRVFRILKKNNIPVLTHFQVLGFLDYFEAARFLFLYPFSFFRFMKSLGNSYEDKVLRYGLWKDFGSLELEVEIRFLLGRRLSSMNFNKIKCIGWYENQASDKNFYRGLRHVLGKVEIIGTQFFWRPATYLFINPDEQEIPFHVIPDRVLVDGSAKYFDSNKIRVDVGPTLRNNGLFDNVGEEPSKGEFILVLMSYYDNVNDFMIRIICEGDWGVPIKIKLHPTTDQKKYQERLSKNFLITNEPLSKLLKSTRIVVGGSSGAQVQIAAKGIPVIDVKNPSEFSHDQMPEIGKGTMWDSATSADEMTKHVRHFQDLLKSDPMQLREEGLRLKSLYFSEPTEELINRAFGFN